MSRSISPISVSIVYFPNVLVHIAAVQPTRAEQTSASSSKLSLRCTPCATARPRKYRTSAKHFPLAHCFVPLPCGSPRTSQLCAGRQPPRPTSPRILGATTSRLFITENDEAFPRIQRTRNNALKRLRPSSHRTASTYLPCATLPPSATLFPDAASLRVLPALSVARPQASQRDNVPPPTATTDEAASIRLNKDGASSFVCLAGHVLASAPGGSKPPTTAGCLQSGHRLPRRGQCRRAASDIMTADSFGPKTPKWIDTYCRAAGAT